MKLYLVERWPEDFKAISFFPAHSQAKAHRYSFSADNLPLKEEEKTKEPGALLNTFPTPNTWPFFL